MTVKILQNRAAPSMVLPHHDISASAKLLLLSLPVDRPTRVCNIPAKTGISIRTVYRAIETLADAGLIIFRKGYVQPNLDELEDWHRDYLMEKNPTSQGVNSAVTDTGDVAEPC